mgnify:CR=1 FL=1
MPYIKLADRKRFVYTPQKLGPESAVNLLNETGQRCSTPGDLNYAFTVIAQAYLRDQGLNYQHINDVVGALEGCKLELYRRVAAPYEDDKIAQNGDVKQV